MAVMQDPITGYFHHTESQSIHAPGIGWVNKDGWVHSPTMQPSLKEWMDRLGKLGKPTAPPPTSKVTPITTPGNTPISNTPRPVGQLLGPGGSAHGGIDAAGQLPGYRDMPNPITKPTVPPPPPPPYTPDTPRRTFRMPG